MSERYFIVTEQSELYHDYMASRSNEADVSKVFAHLKERFGIEATTYLPGNKRISIKPTDADYEKFKSQFMAECRDYGLRDFKIRAEVNKFWVDMLKAANLTVVRRPHPIHYMPYGYKLGWSLWDLDGVVYMCYRTDIDYETPEGMTEIKGSEYHKAIEDYEERNDGRQDQSSPQGRP